MAFDKFSDKAKETVDKAKETAAKVLDAGSESVIKAKDAAAESAIKAKDTAADIIDVGKGKLQEGMATVIEETNNIKTILQNSGYCIIDISVTISVPPKAILLFEDTGSGKEKLTELLESEGSTLSKMQTAMIKTMLKTYDLVKITEEHGYRFGKFNLTVTIPPQVTVHLVADK
ncbi:MAG TPA: hypothetical protein G4O11_10545 [Anaerolineae bacterium]|nr:hypothetical protein [Anaerolineae bacterium]